MDENEKKPTLTTLKSQTSTLDLFFFVDLYIRFDFFGFLFLFFVGSLLGPLVFSFFLALSRLWTSALELFFFFVGFLRFRLWIFGFFLFCRLHLDFGLRLWNCFFFVGFFRFWLWIFGFFVFFCFLFFFFVFFFFFLFCLFFLLLFFNFFFFCRFSSISALDLWIFSFL